MPRGDEGIYKAIEKALKASPVALTSTQLHDDPNIRQYARHVNKVSDTLGNMWRRGYLTRVPAPKEVGSQAKWAYQWARPAETKPPLPRYTPPPTPAHRATGKPSIDIEEATGRVTIELDTLVITIAPK